MSQTPVKPDPESPPSTPRWVKMFGIIALILVLLIVIALATGLGGPHGPRRHIPPGEPNGHIPTLEQSKQEL